MKTKRVLVSFLLVALIIALWILFSPGSGKPRATANTEPTPSGPTPAVKAEWDKLRGSWEFTSMEVEGESKPDADFKKYTLVIEDGQWTIFEYGKPLFRTSFILDPTQNPKAIDIFPANEAGGGQVIRGIYEFAGDTWRLCDRDVTRGARPTEFATKPDSGLVLVSYQRVKK